MKRRNPLKMKAKRKKTTLKQSEKLKTRNRRSGKQESKVTERKDETEKTGRRAPSSKFDDNDDEIPIFDQMGKIQCANSVNK
jgi:hypothetical protein